MTKEILLMLQEDAKTERVEKKYLWFCAIMDYHCFNETYGIISNDKMSDRLRDEKEKLKSRIVKMSQEDIFWEMVVEEKALFSIVSSDLIVVNAESQLLGNLMMGYTKINHKMNGMSRATKYPNFEDSFELCKSIYLGNKNKFKELEATEHGRHKLFFLYQMLLLAGGSGCSDVLHTMKDNGMNIGLSFLNKEKISANLLGHMLPLMHTHLFQFDKNEEEQKKLTDILIGLESLFSCGLKMSDVCEFNLDGGKCWVDKQVIEEDKNCLNAHWIFGLKNDELLDFCLDKIREEKIDLLETCNGKNEIYKVMLIRMSTLEDLSKAEKITDYLANYSSKEDNEILLNKITKMVRSIYSSTQNGTGGMIGEGTISIYQKKLLNKVMSQKFTTDKEVEPSKRVKKYL